MTAYTYPCFSPGQTLKSDDLNHLVDFLDQQNRWTRTRLIGMGILNGLEYSWNADDKLVEISTGVGVTSEGYLLNIDETCLLDSYTGVSNKTQADFICDGKQDTVDGLWELLSDGNGDSKLTSEFLKNKKLLLFWDKDKVKRKPCINECDDKGADVHIQIRKFLMDKASFDLLEFEQSQGGGVTQLPEFDHLSIYRFGYFVDEGICLHKLTTAKEFVLNYIAICEASIEAISQAYDKVYTHYHVVLGDDRSFDLNTFQTYLTELLNKVKDETLLSEESWSIQYVHDYLKELIMAYEEFVCLEIIQTDAFYPGDCDFPRHVTLGCFDNDTAVDYGGRTEHYPAPHFNMDAGMEEAKSLYRRMLDLVDKNNIGLPVELPNPRPEKDRTRITPSRGKNYLLGERAIPYYYEVDNLKDNWKYNNCWRLKNHESHLFHYEIFNTNPLLYDIEHVDFFRVEGYVGRDLIEVTDEIKALRQKLNLPFDIVVVKLEEKPESDIFSCPEMDQLYCNILDGLFCKLSALNKTKDEELELLLESLEELQNNGDRDPNEQEGDEQSTDRIEEIRSWIKQAWAFLERVEGKTKPYFPGPDTTLYFHDFAQMHPGLEHLAGVPKGGTLVLVYIDKPMEAGALMQMIQGLNTSTRSRFERAEAVGVSTSRRIINPALTDAQTVNPYTSMVVADFCLPYHCCTPQTKKVDRQPPPEDVVKADFIERCREYQRGAPPEGESWAVNMTIGFENRSLPADKYTWFSDADDFDPTKMDQDGNIKIDFLVLADPKEYEVKLTAEKGDLSDEAKRTITGCPSSEVHGNIFDVSELTLDRSETANTIVEFFGTVAGGQFTLVDGNGNIVQPSIGYKADTEGRCFKFTWDYSNLDIPRGQYELIYSVELGQHRCDYKVVIPVTVGTRTQGGGQFGEIGGGTNVTIPRSRVDDTTTDVSTNETDTSGDAGKTMSSEFKNLKTVKAGIKLMEQGGADEKSEQEFDEIIQKIFQYALRSNQDRKKEYESLFGRMLESQMQKVLKKNRGSIPEATLKKMEVLKVGMKEAGMKISNLPSTMNLDTLTSKMDAKTNDAFKKWLNK